MKKERTDNVELAKKQDEIIQALFNCITSDGFDYENLDLSKVSDEQLTNFTILTSSFLVSNNFEEILTNFSDDDISNLLSGKFLVKELPSSKMSKIKDKNGNPLTKKDLIKGKVYLNKIQDTTYYAKISQYTFPEMIYIFAQTDEPKIDQEMENFNISPRELLIALRNAIVHENPKIEGDKLNYHCIYGSPQIEFNIKISRMWLRCFSELLLQKNTFANENEILNIFLTYAEKNPSQLNTPSERKNLILSAKNYFPHEAREKFFLLVNFIENRIKYYPDFNNKSIEDKIRLLAAICANNATYITTKKGTINPLIIYNLQTIVSQEFRHRGKKANISEETLKQTDFINISSQCEKLYNDITKYYKKFPLIQKYLDKIEFIYDNIDEYEDILQKISKIVDNSTDLSQFNKNQITELIKLKQKCVKLYNGICIYFQNHSLPNNSRACNPLDSYRKNLFNLNNKLSIFLNNLKDLYKHESSNTEYNNIGGMKYLNLEAAFNLLCIETHNSLITSGLYDEILKRINHRFKWLNEKQDALLSQFKFEDLFVSISGGNFYPIVGNSHVFPYTKSRYLDYMRHAICHDNASYEIIKPKGKEKPTINDLIVTYYSDTEKDGKVYTTEISGKLIDFHKFFRESPFIYGREEEQGKIKE